MPGADTLGFAATRLQRRLHRVSQEACPIWAPLRSVRSRVADPMLSSSIGVGSCSVRSPGIGSGSLRGTDRGSAAPRDELPSSDDLFPYLCYIQRELDPTVLAGTRSSRIGYLTPGPDLRDSATRIPGERCPGARNSATADFSAAFDEEGADRLPESAWQTIASGRAEELRLNGYAALSPRDLRLCYAESGTDLATLPARRYNRAWWVNP
eukprot:956572-Rhodomonas_salina.2